MTSKEQRSRASHLKRVYGITLQQYQDLLDSQGGCCAICGKHHTEFARHLAVDHDHATGEIRGCLCSNCNHRVLGRHRSGDLLRKMADYVERHTGWFVPPKPKRKKRKTNVG